MTFEKSCGAIVITTEAGITKTLIIRMLGGHWSYPKGHVEDGETEVVTAKREIKEETNLEVEIDEAFREMTTYSPKTGIMKDVIYFIAYAKNKEVTIQESELIDYKWLTLDEAVDLVTYKEDKEILRKAINYLNSKE